MTDILGTMREGYVNEATAALKRRLNEIGYDCGDGMAFDRRMTWAVRWFRSRNHMPDGDGADRSVWQRAHSAEAVKGTDVGFVYYSMKDPMWADYPYNAANTQDIEVMSGSACGPTSMAMAVSTALQRAVLPPVLADWSNAHGYRDPNGLDGTDDAFFPACARLYGLKATVFEFEGMRSFEHIAREIERGSAVISNVREGSPFTRVGHYNLIRAIEANRVAICDAMPKNMELPRYTLEDWIDQRMMKRYAIIGR